MSDFVLITDTIHVVGFIRLETLNSQTKVCSSKHQVIYACGHFMNFQVKVISEIELCVSMTLVLKALIQNFIFN